MNFSNALFLVPVLCLAFVIRIMPSLGSSGMGNDPHFYLLVAREINKTGKIPEKIEEFIGPNDNFKPPFLSILLSPFLRVFSTSTLLIYFNPFLECINMVLFYLFISKFNSNAVALLACIFYAFSPILVQNSVTLIQRPLTIFLFIVNIYSLWITYYELNILFFGLSVFSLSLLLITHRSSIQVSLGVLLTLSLFYARSSFPIYIIGSILLSIFINILINRQNYILLVKEHLKFFFGYPTGPIEIRSIPGNPPIVGGFFFLFLYLTNIVLKLKILNGFISMSSIDSFIWYNFLLFVGVILVYTLDFWGRYNSAYFPFIVIPSCFLNAILVDKWIIEPYNYLWFFLIISTSIFLCFRSIHFIKKHTLRITKPLLSLFSFIKMEKEPRILCLPSDYSHPVAYYTGKKVLYGGEFEFIKWARENLDPIIPGLMKNNFDSIRSAVQKFSITHIFIDKSKVKFNSFEELPCFLIFKINEYELYEI